MTLATESSSESSRRLGSLERPLSIGDLTDLIKTNLERSFVDIIISGEISNFKPHPSGHFYFSLKDERATISAVMFRGENSKLKFSPQDGLKVIATGRITVYPPRGNYQILITRLEPAGLGALQLAFEQLKKKLEAEGLFAPERKRPIPRFPKTVGLVTASSGAALQDMLNVLNRRFAGVHILLMPVKVQGISAKEEIALGLMWLNEFFPEIDVIIVGRGGGSIEDLWAFNEEIVARAIAKSRIPVVSAVGHEVDFTIADFVADLRAPTPSAAAELVIGNKLELIQHLENLVRRLAQITHRLDYAQMKVDELVQRLEHALREKISNLQLRVERLKSSVMQQSPAARVKNYQLRWQYAVERLQKSTMLPLERTRQMLERYQQQLRLLNPMTIMERGYSIVRVEKSKAVVKKVSDVRMGDKLVIELWKGKITARVQ